MASGTGCDKKSARTVLFESELNRRALPRALLLYAQ